MRRKTQEEFEKQFFDLVGDEFSIVGKYTGDKNKIAVKHNQCNNIFEIKANILLHIIHVIL